MRPETLDDRLERLMDEARSEPRYTGIKNTKAPIASVTNEDDAAAWLDFVKHNQNTVDLSPLPYDDIKGIFLAGRVSKSNAEWCFNMDKAPQNTSLLIHHDEVGVCEGFFDNDKSAWFLLDGTNSERVWVHDFYVYKAVLTSLTFSPTSWRHMPTHPSPKGILNE